MQASEILCDLHTHCMTTHHAGRDGELVNTELVSVPSDASRCRQVRPSRVPGEPRSDGIREGGLTRHPPASTALMAKPSPDGEPAPATPSGADLDV